MPALQAPPPAPAADPTEEEDEVSKLRGPSCSGTFLISMLSFRSMRGALQPSAAVGESGDEGVWPWLDSDLVDAVDALLL